MKLVSHGVSRQEAHEQIRVLSREAVHTVKNEGKPNDLIERIKKSEFFVCFPFAFNHAFSSTLFARRRKKKKIC